MQWYFVKAHVNLVVSYLKRDTMLTQCLAPGREAAAPRQKGILLVMGFTRYLAIKTFINDYCECEGHSQRDDHQRIDW